MRRLANRGSRTIEDFADRDWQLSITLDGARDLIETLLITTVEGLAANRPDRIVELLTTLTVPKARGLERAIVKGLPFGHDSLADDVLSWLCARPSRFRLGDGHHETHWEPARTLIARFSPHGSTTVFHRLEEEILAYHDPSERKSVEWQLENLRENRIIRNDWGRAQNVLLTALPATRMSDRAKRSAAAWRAKFGDSAKEEPACRTTIGGRVTSPIPPDRLEFVSDREWLRIIRSKWPEREARRWREHGSGLVGEASVRHFADALGTTARQNPKRFAALALRIPKDANPAYISNIVRELTNPDAPDRTEDWEPTSVKDLEAIFDHVGDCTDDEYVSAVCWAVQRRDDGRWSDYTVDRVVSYTDHPKPRENEFTVHRGTGEDRVPDVGLMSINCVRGVVAGAIRALLWRQPDLYGRLLPTVRRLLSDSHPAVRYEAIGACLPIWNAGDKDLAVSLALEACDHEDERVLGSRWLNRFIPYARTTHLQQLTAIIERMAKSTYETIAESGATWACACWLDNRQFADLVMECRAGSKAQRLGVTNAASDYFANDRAIDVSLPILLRMFSDSDGDVRLRAAGVFKYRDVFAVSSTVQLAAGFVESDAFPDEPDNMLHALAEYSGALACYSRVILNAADVMSGPLAEQTRGMRARNAFAGNELSTLLIRIYELAYGSHDKALQEQCLDRWDRMLQARVGMTEEHFRQFDD